MSREAHVRFCERPAVQFRRPTLRGNRKSGILWAVMPRRNNDAFIATVPGVLRAYAAYPDVGDVMVELWNSDDGIDIPDSCESHRPPAQEGLGSFAKFVAPTIAEGKVYMATFSNKLVVYGLARE